MPNRPRRRPLFIPLALLLAATSSLASPALPRASGQGTREDYERSAGLAQTMRGKVFRARVEPHWFDEGKRFWYRNELADRGREFVLVDAESGTREPAFDHQRLAEMLQEAGVDRAQADRLPIEALEFQSAENAVLFRAGGKGWRCDLSTYELAEREVAQSDDDSLVAQRPEVGPRASTRTGPETSLTFVNRTRGEVELFWLDGNGDRQSYGKLAAGDEHEQHTYAGHVWLVVNERGRSLAVFEATEAPSNAIITGRATRGARQGGERPDDESGQGDGPRRRIAPRGVSPNGRWRAFIRDTNVWLADQENDEEFPLSDDGTEADAYTNRFYWSPDSTRLVALRTKDAPPRMISFVESSPRDQVQPKLHTFEYRKPGDDISLTRPRLFHVTERKPIPISEELFPNPWSISQLRWDADSSRFLFLYNQRGHQVLRIIAVDASGVASKIVDENSPTFLDYNGKLFLRFLDDAGDIVWMSERDGWNHLYLYDARTGQVKNQITSGPWVVRGVDRVDEQARQIWFRAGGIYPDQDPYHVHYGHVNFDGTGLTLFTQGDGTHSIQYSPDRRFFIDTYSRVDLPPVTELRRAEDGQLVCQLERAGISQLAAAGWQAPERFVAKGRDGETDIYGVIYRPTNFDPHQKYPVLEAIYAGPQGAFVPKRFSSYHDAQGMAELGFIVVQIDGMGTNYRSKAFHDVCWRNLSDSGFPDRIAWMKAAAVDRPFLDLDRVGLYGGSAGGQSALAGLLHHGDFYKAGMAACGCHDNRMDKIWWNELWMGWPVGPEYDEQSNVTHAAKLKGKLLLIVGEMDRNVDPASTMQVVNALVRADKDFDLVVMPGAGHGTGGAYGRRRTQDFFVRNLLGVEPRAE